MSNYTTVRRVLGGAILAILSATAAPAQASVTAVTGNPLTDGILATIIYGFIGIVMALFGAKLLDLVTPGDMRKLIAEEKNMAMATVVGFMMLGICIIIAAAIAG